MQSTILFACAERRIKKTIEGDGSVIGAVSDLSLQVVALGGNGGCDDRRCDQGERRVVDGFLRGLIEAGVLSGVHHLHHGKVLLGLREGHERRRPTGPALHYTLHQMNHMRPEQRRSLLERRCERKRASQRRRTLAVVILVEGAAKI